MASRISSVVTLSTFIGLPVSIPLGAVSLAGVSISGMTTVLNKKYQKELTNVKKLVEIIMSALVVFETNVSKVLSNSEIDEWEFATLETLHLGALNELANVDYKMEAKKRAQLQKSILEEINNLKKAVKGAS